MAKSTKRQPDSFGSLNVGSDEDFDYSCEPCLTSGQHVKAYGYCMECKDYLCNTCFKKHQRTKASKNHQLLNKVGIDKRDMSKTHSDMCFEECQHHKYQVLQYFCLQHEELVCHVCATLNHRTCDLDYIPEKCAGIGDSEEFRSTVWLLSMTMTEVDNVRQKAIKKRKEIDTHQEDLIKGIDDFQDKVNDRLQQIRKDIQTEIDKKDSLNRQTVKDVLDFCTTISSEITKFQTKLQESKTEKQNAQLYTTIKQAMLKLKADEITKSDEKLDEVDLQNGFEPNPDLQVLLSTMEGFGKLTNTTSLVTPLKMQVELIQKIDIGTKLDKCNITGCAVLLSNKLVLADENNKKLKVLDTQSNLVVMEKKFDSSPFDVTTLSADQIAVTFPSKKAITIMTSGRKLSTAHTVHVKGLCKGISYHQEHLFTVCNEPNAVVILDKKGTVHNTISLNEQLEAPYGITVSSDSKIKMYVSDTAGRSIVSTTLLGEISEVNKKLFRPQSALNKTPLGPAGMTMLDDGSLMVCCTTGSIHLISADLKQSQDIVSGLHKPCSICFDHQLNIIYVGGVGCNNLKVYSLTFV